VFVLSVSVLRFDPRMTIHHSAAPERQGKSDWLRYDQSKGEHTAILMTGANSAVGLRSMAARYLFLDEVDG
jgi:phage terminase large subunit GpA-like protein